MSDATLPADLLPPSRSGRLLSLVRKLFDYGVQLARTIRERGAATDPAELVNRFGTGELLLILARITLGIERARLLGEKITRTAASIDAEPRPEPEPSPRTPRAVPCAAQPRVRGRCEPQPTDTASLIAKLPTIGQIAAKVRRQPIGAVLADICRDLGIGRDHPLWTELHAAIMEYGGSLVRLVRDRLNQLFPIAHILARLKSERATPPEPGSTGPPPAPA